MPLVIYGLGGGHTHTYPHESDFKKNMLYIQNLFLFGRLVKIVHKQSNEPSTF